MLKLEQLAEEMRLGNWSLDCPEMKLGQASSSEPTEYAGPGYLRQEPDGTITYKIYPPPSATFDPTSLIPRIGVPGRILDETVFHQLESTGIDGTIWRSDRTLPSPHTSFVVGRLLRVVTGATRELVTTYERTHSNSSLRMMVFTEARVPCNASTKVTTDTPNGSTRWREDLDTAKFSTAFGDFNIYNRPGMLLVEVVSPRPFPAHFETRIVESLGFVLTKSLAWNVLELVEKGVETVRLRGRRDTLESRLRPPVVDGTIDMSHGDVWQLFEKYLTMACTHTESGFHPASRHLFSVLEASAGAISARGLALGVAVEGICKVLFPNAAAPPNTLRPAVERLRAYFLAWDEFRDETTRAALYERVERMLGRILEVNCKSRLYALAADKAVDEAHIKAWSVLRNTSAHGVTAGSEDIERLVDLCDAVTVLMYHIIFRAIGYEGRYRDYSVPGWPTKYYEGRPPSGEDLAVAAS